MMKVYGKKTNDVLGITKKGRFIYAGMVVYNRIEQLGLTVNGALLDDEGWVDALHFNHGMFFYPVHYMGYRSGVGI